jgi:hypothetical protein
VRTWSSTDRCCCGRAFHARRLAVSAFLDLQQGHARVADFG